MKARVVIFLLLIAATPVWAAQRVTVQQFKDLVISLNRAKKTDLEVAEQLRQIELTEELTPEAEASVRPYLPGPRSSDQMDALEANSAMLAPPASDLPSTPTPDAAAQKALLDKAVDYTTRIYAQLPHLTAVKSTERFQDNMESGVVNRGANAYLASPLPGQSNNNSPFALIETDKKTVESAGGTEAPSKEKDRTEWGANGQIVLRGQGPVLTTVLQEAQASGKLSWLRWETVKGKQIAVFSFSVDKKKTHYLINDCCFLDVDQNGDQFREYSPVGKDSYVAWKDLKTIVPYHGELFVDPETGTIVRLVTQADLKGSKVHQEDTRIDYGPVTVAGKQLIVPVQSYVNTEVVASDAPGAGKYIVRRTMFAADYRGYQ